MGLVRSADSAGRGRKRNDGWGVAGVAECAKDISNIVLFTALFHNVRQILLSPFKI